MRYESILDFGSNFVPDFGRCAVGTRSLEEENAQNDFLRNIDDCHFFDGMEHPFGWDDGSVSCGAFCARFVNFL